MDNTCLVIEARNEATDDDYVFVDSVRDGTQDGKCNAGVGHLVGSGQHSMHLGKNCFVSTMGNTRLQIVAKYDHIFFFRD